MVIPIFAHSAWQGSPTTTGGDHHWWGSSHPHVAIGSSHVATFVVKDIAHMFPPLLGRISLTYGHLCWREYCSHGRITWIRLFRYISIRHC